MPSQEPVGEADQLRNPQMALLPDSRSDGFARFQPDGSTAAVTLDDRFDAIKACVLNETVPHDVRVHFETAKNLYLYAWFVYRFFPVAETHVLTTLEFALRERLSLLYPDRYGPAAEWVPGMAKMLKQAREDKLIANHGMRAYHHQAMRQARDRVADAAMTKLIESGAEAIEYDPNSAVPMEQDYAWDALETYLETLPAIRNSYAHGSSNLHATVLGTFEIVTDLINQLFPSSASDESGATVSI
jgi:hypothetical protein